MASYTYRLPFPPSVNHHWRSFVPRGRNPAITIISQRGRDYRDEVCDLIYSAPMLTGRLAVVIEFTMPNRQRRDIDNFCKVILDSLVVCVNILLWCAVYAAVAAVWRAVW